MKKKIQVMLFFLIMIVLVGIIGSNQVFAADEYSLSIEPISYSPQSNLMQRSVTVPSAVSDFENVQVDKYCYTGETFSLTAIIVPANAYVGKVNWTIEQDETIAKIVSQNGLTVSIKGEKAGTCKIVCTAADGQGAYTTCNLTVLQHAMYINLSPKELLLEPGDREQIIATIVPADTTDKTISWSSSNPEIAKVDKDGVVTGVSASLEPVTITCKVLDGSGVEATATVNVRVLVEVIEWQKFSNVIYKKGTNTEKFYTSVLPSHATIPTLKYTSSNTEVASLMADPNDNSCILITPKNPGKFNIICETTDGSNVKLVTEVEVIQLLEYVTLSDSSKILFLKDGVTVTHQLQVKSALPSNANILNNGIENAFIWSSSDTKIATVNQTGLVTALKPGTVTITATSKDLGATSASCTIYVRKPVTSMEIDLYSYEYIQDSGSMDVNLLEKLKYLNGIAYVYAGDTVALNAAFNDDATLKTVTWQIAGKGTDASGANILGIFAKVSDPYTNPTIMTALPINADNENGYLNVVITVKANDGSNVTAKRVIQIRQPATTLTINKTTMTLYAPGSGEGYATMEKLNVSILPENAYVNKNPDSFSDGSIIWISSDESVATVSSEGHVNAIGPGEATIYAKSADGYGEVVSCKVTVLQAIKNIEMYAYQDENKIEIEHQDSIYAYTNQEIRLFTNITPANASNQKLTWNSGNPLIATVDNGYLKIGNKPTVTSESSSYITISCSATDGSGKTLMFYLYVLDSEYNIDVKDFLSITSGSSDKLLLKVSKNDTSSGTPISVPIKSDITVSLSGNSVTAGDNSYEIIELYDESGKQIKNSVTLDDVTNPSFDIKARYNGVVTVKFNVKPQDVASLPDDCTLIGKTISFERTCTINVTGNDNRTISISQSSLSMLVNEKKQINAVVLPATATNYYIKYGMKGYNDDYANPYEFARINEDTGIITGFEVGIVVVTATLYDSTTNKVVNTNGIDQVAEVPVYITESLTGVKMDDSFVYVGEEISLLDSIQFTPTALNKTLDKASAVRFNVVSGGEHIKFSANSFGHVQGVSNGEVVIEAIATYGDAIYTSNQAKITVKSRLNGISLVGSYGLKLNEMIKLNPTRNPSNGDLSQATITWTSSNTDYVTVTNNKDDGYNGLIGIVTARKATPSGNPVTVTLTVKTDKDTFTAKTEITVIPLDVDNFSADTTNKLYTLSTDGWQFYCYGAYALKSSGGHYAAGCLENGASSLSTVYLYNNGETSWYKGTYKYPSNYPLRTFVALERAETLVEQAAAAAGISKQDMINRIDAGLRLATAVMGTSYYDDNAYLDLPGRSHLWVKSGNSYVYNSDGFLKWGHTSNNSINIFSGLLHSFDKEASAEQVVSDLSGKFLTTHMNSNQTKLAGSYFTSALTSMNVLNGSPEVAKRQANAISIIGTYFPLDKVYQESGASTQYQKLHAARQMLIWSAAGIKVDSTEYNRRKASNPDYVSATENYYGSTLYYVSYMVQADDEAANYMYYPHGYSAFYYAIKNILAPSRVTNYSTNIDKIMVIIEGFAWKLDQVKHRTIPSFAQKDAEAAKLDANTIKMHYDASKNQYVATVCDTNGVLNYYNFILVDPGDKNPADKNKPLATFKNNGDGTLTISVPAANVERIKEIQDNLEKKSEYQPASAAPELIPEDNLYECAAFAKWEMETEISQIPYTKANGSLGYVYMIGNNVQSQYIDVQNEMIKSNLGDPYEAYIAFSFDNPDTFDSVVESDVKIYDTNGNEVEYIIPNEQYQLKYIFTYTGHSRGLKVVDTNANLTARGTANVYGFAADMRARTNDEGDLITIINTPGNKNNRYVDTSTSSTITTPIWTLDADKVPVKIEGGYTTYDTGTGVENKWKSGDAWNDNIYIDANVGDNQLFSNQEMVDSSQHPTHVTVRRTDDGKVEITWVFYTAYTTFTTPYVNAFANITIDQDKTHPATKQLNQPNEDTDRYIYGLVIDGKRSVQGYPSSARVTISSFNDYVSNYSFTGMVNTAKRLPLSGEVVQQDDVVWSLFQDVNYKNGNKSLSEYSLGGLFDIGTNTSGIGTIYFYQQSGSIVGIIVDMGSHEGVDFCIYWRSSNAGGTGKFTGDTWDNGVRAMSGCNLMGQRNYENYVHKTSNGDDGEGDDNIGSTATHNPTSDGMTTSFINSAQWAVPTNKLGDFTLTNAETYGGSGYLNANFGYTYANNAQNYTTFHTDKTFQTVFDLSISDLVVNTGAGITSPTSVDTRNFVNLNIYYTINLDNSAYKVITNRYGQIGGVWWHYFKNTDINGQTDKAATKYEYKMKDFFYYDGTKRVYCDPKTGKTYPEAGVTYYYDPNHTGDDSLPDSKSANGNIGDFIPDDRQHLVSGSPSSTRPVGWAEEKTLDITIHTDTFTNFYIYDNADIPAVKKLDPAEFSILDSDEQWRTLSNITPTTGVYFIDNVQTGENYIQHTVPYVLTTIESGVKIYGFSAHVNKTYNNGSGVVLSSGDAIRVKNAMAEWGEKVGKSVPAEWTGGTKPKISHLSSNANMDFLYQSSSVLGYSTSYRQRNKSFSQPLAIGRGLYKNYYYESVYDWSYNNNDTATSMLQYPAYNPYTLSIVSSNGSLIYKNKANVTGFDIVLGNNQNTHIPNTDNISYLMYLRKFGANGVNNAVPINGTYSTYYYNGSDSFINNGSVKTNNFVYGSVNFYKYSNSTYYVYNANGANTNPSSTIKVEGTSASTELVNETETETMKFTKILFKSTYTVSRNLGDKGWVDITSGNNPDAIVNAGKGFELKIEVTYTNNNLTDYLSRYLKDSAQVGKTSSALSGVTSTGCNISPLTGEMGTKSMTDQYTAKVLENKVWNNVFGANLYEDIYVIMNNNNKYVYSYTGVYGSTQVFDLETTYNYDSASESGSVVMTYTMKLSPVNGFFGNTSDSTDKTGLATQNMKFYTDASAAGTVGSLTIWTNPIAATPFGYPGNMRDRYLADLAQIQYYIVQPVDNVDNIVQ